MKIMLIILPYDTYIDQFYKKNSGLNKKSSQNTEEC